MGHNTFGHEFALTTFGESHGAALGLVIDGIESGFEIDWSRVSSLMDKRRPGANPLGTTRSEKDEIEVLSGMYRGRTTGTPLALLIRNTDRRSGDYDALSSLYRPGHADYTYEKKYGIRDPRGGGRSSGRETACRVAAGAIAMQLLEKRGISVMAGTIQIGKILARRRDWDERGKNPLFCPDGEAARAMEAYIGECEASRDSTGGVIECRATGVPAGLGDPLFDKIDANLARAILSIGAVKGIEFGEGFAAAGMKGSENNDEMEISSFLSNHAGGMLGGITTGEEIVFRAAFKPTPSIAREQKTITREGRETILSVGGRHDPCVCPRAVVVVEAMCALVLIDAYYEQFGRKS